jgi:hypothetical protein
MMALKKHAAKATAAVSRPAGTLSALAGSTIAQPQSAANMAADGASGHQMRRQLMRSRRCALAPAMGEGGHQAKRHAAPPQNSVASTAMTNSRSML